MSQTRRIVDPGRPSSDGDGFSGLTGGPIPVRSTGWAKRAFDLVGAAVLLVLTLPLMVLAALLAKLQSPGPILYRAVRVGRGGRPFVLYKFRSMVADADRRGPGVTAADDGRTTRIGRILRRFKLDELPNLVNVVRGEMSLVGPRPELPRYVAYYTPEQLEVLSVRPGITGPTQLLFRHEEDWLRGQTDPEQFYVETLLPKKLGIDLEYVRTRTFWKDLGYLAATAAAILQEVFTPFRRKGSC